MAHRVSYEVFKGPVPAGVCVLHQCDNPLCVNPEHLFLGDNYDNARDCVAKGRRPSIAGNTNPARLFPQRLVRGEDNHKSKLTAAGVLEIRRRHAQGMSFNALGKMFGVSHGNIAKVVRRQSWAHVMSGGME
jgi:hypothetical protein